MESYGEKIVKGTTFLFFMTALASLIGYLTRMILSRSLPKEEFGLFYSILAFVGMTTILYDLGLTNAVARFSSFYSARRQYGKVKETVLITLIVRIFLSLVIFSAVLIFSDKISLTLFHTQDSRPLIILMLATVIAVVYSIFLSYAQGMRMVYLFGMGEFLRNLMSLLFVLLLISHGLIGVCYAYLLANVVLSLFFMISSIAKTTYVFKAKAKINISYALKLFSYSIPLFLAGFAGLVLSYTDTLMISYFKGLEQVAYYQIAMPTSRVLWNFVGSLLPVIFPIATAMVSLRETKKLALTFELMTKIIMTFVIPASFLMFLYPNIIITLLFGPKYVSASPILKVLAFIAIFYSFNAAITSFLAAEGNTKKISKIIGMTAIFNFFANLIAIPPFGAVGAAAATLCSYIFGFYLFGKEARRMKLPLNYLTFFKFLVAGAVFASVVAILKHILTLNPYVEMAIVIPLSFVAYLILLVKTGLITKTETEIFRRLIKKIV